MILIPIPSRDSIVDSEISKLKLTTISGYPKVTVSHVLVNTVFSTVTVQAGKMSYYGKFVLEENTEIVCKNKLFFKDSKEAVTGTLYHVRN